MIAEKQTNDSLAVQIADQVVPEYRAKGAAYSCSGHTAKRWSAAHDAALIALQRSALSQPADDLLVAALKPFARYMHTDEERMDCDHKFVPLVDDQGVQWLYLTHGDFRRARAAISPNGGAA